jgi:predicted TIM-barrel fold metal-dependent hydrolase
MPTARIVAAVLLCAAQVLFGTNYPMLTASACLEALGSLGLGADATRCFLFENAVRVFELDDLVSV